MRVRLLLYGSTICVPILLLALTTKMYQHGWQMIREHTFQIDKGESDHESQLVYAGQLDQEPHHIYLMAERYSGQQSAGINALASLQCWGGRLGLNATIVEPSISNTTITGSFKKNGKVPTTGMTLGNYIDIPYLNAAARQVGSAEVITQKEFFKKPLKRVIYIKTAQRNHYKVLWSSDDPANPCYKGKIRLLPPMQQLKRRGYCIVRVMDVSWSNLKIANLKDILGKYYNQSITLALSKWNGPWFVYEKNLSLHCRDRKPRNWFVPSERLVKDAKSYEDTYLGSKNSLSIMIRLEHVLILNKRKKQYTVPYCLQQVTDLRKSLQERGQSNHTLMVAADIGFYGSGSFGWAIKDEHKLAAAITQVKNMLPVWLDHHLSYDEWEWSFVKTANGVTNQGYIAALQRVIASRADCLVLVGGGNFQELALSDYLRLHADKATRCIHTVCADNDLNRAVQLANQEPVNKN